MSFIDKNLKVGVEKLDEGQTQLVKQLENLVDDPSIDVIGLEGEWGSGKSTILKVDWYDFT